MLLYFWFCKTKEDCVVANSNLDSSVWGLMEKLRGIVSYDKYQNIILKLFYLSKEMEKLNFSSLDDSKNFINQTINSNILVGKILRQLPQALIENQYTKLLMITDYITSNVDLSHISEFFKTNSFNTDGFDESTPNSIIEIVKKDLLGQKFNSVLDIGAGSGNFLVGIKDLILNKSVSAVEINHSHLVDLEIRLNELELKSLNIFDKDCLQNPLFDEIGFKNKYDVVFSNYPFSMRIEKDIYAKFDTIFKDGFTFNNKSLNNADWLYISLILNYLSERGRGYAVSTLGVLFRTPEVRFREELLNKNKLLAVIELPGNLFNYTAIPTCLMIFGNNTKNKVRMVKASDLIIKGRRKSEIDVEMVWNIYNNESEISRDISYKEIEENEFNLSPSKYLNIPILKIKNPTPLKNVIEETFRGYQITADELDQMIVSSNDDYTSELLTLSDISEFGIVSDKLKKIKTDEKDLSRYYLKDNDILVSSKSTKIKVSLFKNKHHKNVLVTGSIIVVRTNQKIINPGYLALFLQSNIGRSLMQSIQSGSVIFNINNSSLEKINIPLIPYEDQLSLFDEYMVNEEMILNHEKNIKALREKNETYLSNFFGSEN
jgi:type I restriction enzyme M protein